MKEANFGIMGLGVMGHMLALNMERNGFRVAGYDLDELIGQHHNIVRHPDMPRTAFKGLWESAKNGNVWNGYVKNRTKEGGFYWVYATVYPVYDEIRNEKTYMSCRRKPSREEIINAEKLYKTLT